MDNDLRRKKDMVLSKASDKSNSALVRACWTRKPAVHAEYAPMFQQFYDLVLLDLLTALLHCVNIILTLFSLLPVSRNTTLQPKTSTTGTRKGF